MHLCLAPRAKKAIFLIALLYSAMAFAQEQVPETPAPDIIEDNQIEEELLEEIPIENAEQKETAVSAPTASPAAPISAISKESEELTYAPDVEVEKSVFDNELRRKSCDCDYSYLMPYKERRNNFGFTFAVGYSQYLPTYYKPDFVVNQTYETYYGETNTPLIDLTLGLKWNNPLGSFTLEAGAGYFFNNSKNEDDNGTLRVIPARAGVTYAMDALASEPVVVPYGTVGAFTAFYNEQIASTSVSGNSPIGLYYAGGLMFQLNSLDEKAAAASFDESGLQNTFVFAEMRGFVASTDVPNFSTDPQLGAGLKLEY